MRNISPSPVLIDIRPDMAKTHPCGFHMAEYISAFCMETDETISIHAEAKSRIMISIGTHPHQ